MYKIFLKLAKILLPTFVKEKIYSIKRIKNSNRQLVSTGREILESRYKNRIKRYEMMEYKISNENVKDTTSKVLEIMEN